MSKEIEVHGVITEDELKEIVRYIAVKSRRMRRISWTPVEKLAMRLFEDEVTEYFKQTP